jgi:hypothetical protein
MIELLKQALEALEHEAEIGGDDAYKKEREAIRKAIAELEKQEPVAWLDRTDLKNLSVCFEPTISKNPVSEYDVPLYASPQPRKPLEGVIEVRPIGYHSLQLIFESQDAIKRFSSANGIGDKS